MRVLVVSGDPAVRATLRHRLSEERGFEVVDGWDGPRPDVVVFHADEGHMPSPEHGFVVRGARVLTVVPRPGLAPRLVTAGADGVLVGVEEALEGLPAAVRRVAEGEVVVDEAALPFLVTELRHLGQDQLQTTAALELAAEALCLEVGEQRATSASLALAREALAAELREVEDTYRATVEALAAAVELRDDYTGGHIQRVSAYALAVASTVDPALAEGPQLFGFMLHDVGKLAVPDAVLLKDTALTEDEFAIIKGHTVWGSELVSGIPFLREADVIVRSHHEHWDGSGYPDGLAGEEIPRLARVFAVVDALDAITTERPYSPAAPLETALDVFRRRAGTQFDPAVVEVFLSIVESAEAFADLRRGVMPGRGAPGEPLRLG